MRQSSSTEFPPFVRDEAPVTGLEQRTESGLISVLMSSRRLLVFVFMIVVFAGAARPVTDPDFWWHLKTGQYLFETRHIPYTDIFSTMRLGSEWVTHEWLSEVFIYTVFRAFGFAGLIVAFSLIITAACWIAYQQIKRRVGHPYVAGFALLLGAQSTAPTWGVRPQMFTFLLASIFIGVLTSYVREGKTKWLWWLAPLMVLWVNLHAGFALGLVLIGLTAVGLALEEYLSGARSYASAWRRVKPLLWLGLVCTAAVFCNPNGARMFLYPLETLRSHAMMRYIDEWLSPNFHKGMFMPLALFFLSTLGAMALSKKRVRITELLLLLVTCLAALRSARNVPFFVLIAMPLLAEHLWAWLTSQSWGGWLTAPEKVETGINVRRKMVLNFLLLMAVPLLFAGVRVRQSMAEQAGVEAKDFPAAAVEYLRTHNPPQPLYNEYHWGGYLVWKLYPDYRVFIDGRADVYGDQFFDEFMSTHAGEPNWKTSLDKYKVQTVMIMPDAALASLLREDQRWQKVFEDQQAVIFTRR
jgi:hypothetical protein